MINKVSVCAAVLMLLAVICLAADKVISDDAIVDNVRIKLAMDVDVKGGALKVDSKAGVVTISGIVETQGQKDKATRLAKRVKGVKSVINNIEVKKRGS
jgi:hyperosmotically inducible periplasmic protein